VAPIAVCDAALLTTRVVAPAETPNTKSPEYVPVIVSFPAGAAEEGHEPLPLDNVAVQSVVDPVVNVTVPLGVADAAPTGVTVVEYVTEPPIVTGLGLAPIEVIEGSSTARVVVPVDPEKVPSPEYAPETVSVPRGAAVELHEPLPLDNVAVQSVVDPVVNVTEPVGVGNPVVLVVTVVE
jgi:hypothetical protein